ncbi:MAG: hypothetical protein HYS12_06460 [Planctomycetes bacterium]|nr:hypothetical protein [Planctomycetota bacterium]
MKSLVTMTALALLLPVSLHADEKDDALAAQRKAAKDNWDRVDAGPSVSHETAHLIVVGPKGMEKQIKETGVLLEKYYDTAAKVLFPPKEAAWPGKLAVYLFEQPEQLDSFIRRVEKRRLVAAEKGTFMAEDARLHAAACPPREKGDPAVRVQAGQQIASAVLMRKAGAQTIVPSWLVAGFGRATHYRVAGSASREVANERSATARFAVRNKRNASDAWAGVLEGEEAPLLQGSVADFLAYGPGRTKFGALLEGFKPEENVEQKTMQQALDAANLNVDAINTNWRRYLAAPR